jgi:hypothetical protein
MEDIILYASIVTGGIVHRERVMYNKVSNLTEQPLGLISYESVSLQIQIWRTVTPHV